MASGQYNYPPPPPPPSQIAGGPSGFQPYNASSYGQGSRGGHTDRGRGGYNARGRGNFAPPVIQHYGPPPQAGAPYGQQSSAPYIGPQAHPPATGTAQSYPPQPWGGQHQPPHNPSLLHQPPAPAPLSAQNYHPNYAPQVYQQPQPQHSQAPYGPQQPPFQQPPPVYNHSNQAAHHPGPSQSWQASAQQGHQSFDGGSRGRGRGGGGSSQSQARSYTNAPLMGPPIRMGFNNEKNGESRLPGGSGYSPYTPPMQGSSPVPPFSSPSVPGGYPSQHHQNSHRSPPSARDGIQYSSNGASHRNDRRGDHRGGRGGGRGGGAHDRGRDHRGDRGGRRGGHKDYNSNDRDRPRFGRDNRASDSHTSIQSTLSKYQPDVAKASDNKDKKKKKKKRKTNTLGLTPGDEEHEDSEEEDDADEENRLVAMEATAQMPTDLAAWLAERKKKWPTAERVAAREAELAKRRAAAAEQSARDRAKAKKERDELAASAAKSAELSETERMQRKADKLRKQLERLERDLEDGKKSGTKRKRDSNDSGDEGNTVKQAGGDLVDQVIEKATASAKDDVDDSSEDTDESESNDDPEEQTSHRTGPAKVQPPSKKNILERQCKYFSTGGVCGKKGKCRFIHDQAVRDAAIREKDLSGGRPTLSQRLVQGEEDKKSLLLIRAIQRLKATGQLDENNDTDADANA